MKERHRARRRRGGAEGLQAVLVGPLQAEQHWHTVGATLPHQVADCRQQPRRRRQASGQGTQIEHDLAAPVLLQVEPDRGRATGDCRADVDEVAVAVGACAQHRVREHDRVALGPGDLLAERRPRRRLVGRAGPDRPAAHLRVALHQPQGLGAALRRARELLRVQQVQAADVQRRRHPDPGAARHQHLREVDARIAVVKAAVDVGALDVQQSAGAVDPGHRDQDAHRGRCSLAVLAREHVAVEVGQFDGSGSVRGRHRRSV